MTTPKNILFIMCDQLRWDYLSCYGHPHLETPNIDRLAERGVRFERAYCQAPICGPSRACFYTGRYMTSHGSLWNQQPISPHHWTLGDYLRPHGYRTVLVGKTHTPPDRESITRLGIDPDSVVGERLAHAGFEPFERDDGLHPDWIYYNIRPNLRYNQYLREQGYDTENPWDRNANGTLDKDGSFGSGWYLRHNHEPANIREEHSETPYMTSRAIDCIESLGDEPWCIHLSYIKPHWPYQVPAPYHAMYGMDHILPHQADACELEDPHPVYQAFADMRVSRTFSRSDVRANVIPAYMGLIKQVDDQIGRLMQWLDENNYLDRTMIVFTSDHGDYLGDHWLGEKSYFHEASVRIPLIVVDPSPSADATRGTVESRYVESIDLIPTFLEAAGGNPQNYSHKLEGRSLLPLVNGQSPPWRDYTVSELDYSGDEARHILGLTPSECRGYMIRNEAWKYILWEGFRPQLFDLSNDPHEFVDLGQHVDYETIRRELHDELFSWLRKRAIRTTFSEIKADQDIFANEKEGVLIGYWSEEDGPFL
ncbi:MAG: sulfatase-like hydrolase/transferase [Chloroflexota bacterium]